MTVEGENNFFKNFRICGHFKKNVEKRQLKRYAENPHDSSFSKPAVHFVTGLESQALDILSQYVIWVVMQSLNLKHFSYVIFF